MSIYGWIWLAKVASSVGFLISCLSSKFANVVGTNIRLGGGGLQNFKCNTHACP